MRQRRKQVPDPLGLIARVKQRLDCLDFHLYALHIVTICNYMEGDFVCEGFIFEENGPCIGKKKRMP